MIIRIRNVRLHLEWDWPSQYHEWWTDWIFQASRSYINKERLYILVMFGFGFSLWILITEDQRIEEETKLIKQLEASYPDDCESLEYKIHHTKVCDAYWRRSRLWEKRETT